MRAVVYHGPRDIRLEEIPQPSPGPGEILVKVGAALTCGTDFKAYRQGHRVLLGDYPSRFGHELAGTVAAAGRGAVLKEGTRVVVANSAPADDCFWCRRGQNQLCPHLKLHNGAYAEFDLIPAHIAAANVHPLNNATAFETAALAEPLACAIHAVEVVSPREGEFCAVIGAGPMAILLVNALRARGARVAVLGRSRPRLDGVLAAGAETVFASAQEAALEAIRNWSEGRGPDHVFEAVGTPATYRLATEMVRNGGKVCLFGGCAQGAEAVFDAHRLHYKQLSLFGVFHHNPPHFREAVRLLESGAVKTDHLVRGSVALKDLPAFFAANADVSIPKTAVHP